MQKIALCNACQSLYEIGGYKVTIVVETAAVKCQQCQKSSYSTICEIERKHSKPANARSNTERCR